MQDYLKAIYQVHERDGSVLGSVLAGRLGLAPASVTKMLGRLAEAGLVSRTAYKAVQLTPRGRSVALRVIRRHRLWETFLHRTLGLDLDQLHMEAERLEHEVSDFLEERMSRVLGYPTHDPHGHPIPGREGQLPSVRYPSLAELAPGVEGEVRLVPDHDGEFLRYLMSLRLVPGERVRVVRREPLDGPLTIVVGDQERVVTPDLARRVLVSERAPQ